MNQLEHPAGTMNDADYRLIVESMRDYAIFMLDPSGVVLSWNPGAERLKGYTTPEIIGQHFSRFYPPELLAKEWPRHALETARDTGKFEEEGWRLRKDGTRFWAHVILTRLDGPDGRLRGFSKFTRDLTERQQEQEKLRASEERFRLMVETVKDYAIFMLDPSGHIVSWNAGARATKGYEATEIVGKHFSIFYPPEVAATGFPDHELKEAYRTGRFEDEGWRVRKDGSRFWASVVITAVRDASGQLHGYSKVTRDLSDRRKMSQLQDENQRMNNFLAVLGHELRNPLAPIANAAEVLNRREQSPAIQRLSQIMLRQVRQITRLVDDLMDLGRTTGGKIRLESRPVSLADVLEEAMESARPAVLAKSHSISLSGDGSQPWIQGDRARMVQVVVNLLNNAVKFTPPQGAISVSLESEVEDALIRVRDNGPGIAPSALPRVFEMFQQGDERARALGGLGLGLTLVRQLVQLHGGEVTAHSSGIAGEGSEFTVRLPRMAAPVVIGSSAETLKRVLIVDDEEDSAETLSLLVEAMGYEPFSVSDGFRALEAIKSRHPHVVLLDFGLPGLSGLEVARRLRMEVADPPPLVAVTGHGQVTDRQASLNAGFYAHLSKPVDAGELQRILDKLLG
ncbi:PAS domain S-box protein [Variovorax sp. OV329]|uniref:PAS domain-containing hybrid sensor histidine kinase/response regulator n=1 Tax=Variovorax sp. OV329 TaxID=1882825 RepID=UPI0008F43F03|nr:PAS domain S-box protein [Variovorax sp. OV329]SFN40732.1 PAS domain S-box-containing protein [Variovorax sp. OV329]